MSLLGKKQVYHKKCPITRAAKEGDAVEGWQGLGPNRGRFVSRAEGFAVACRGCGILQWNPRAAEAAEFKAMLEEWYFSGNWIWKEDTDEEQMDLAGL